MMHIHHQHPLKRSPSDEGSGSLAGGPPASYDDVMEKRVLTLEDFKVEADKRFDRIEARLDQTATKADLAELRTEMHKGFADIIKWMVGLIFLSMATGITVITFVLNYGVPKLPGAAAAGPAMQPIIIQLPAATTAPPLSPPPLAPPR